MNNRQERYGIIRIVLIVGAVFISWATGAYASAAEPAGKKHIQFMPDASETSSAPTSPKVAYITLDDGPDASYTPQVLDVLKRYKVRATFFVVGYKVQAHPEILLSAYYDGHQIGNHTFSHKYNELYKNPGPENYLGSLKQNEDLINAIIGIKPRITRPPGGAAGNFNASFYQDLPPKGYRTIIWNVNAGDSNGGATSETMINNVKAQVAVLPPGTPPIILMHDIHGQTVAALPPIIDFLRSQGYRFDVITPDKPANIDKIIF